MRLLIPREKLLVLLIVILCVLARGGWLLHDAIHGRYSIWGPNGNRAELILLLVVCALAVFGFLRQLRAWPMTYAGGTYRVRRQMIEPESQLIFGPIVGVAGRHLSFAACIRFANSGSLRGGSGNATASVRLAVVRVDHFRHIHDKFVIVYAEGRDGEGTDNAAEMEADIPSDIEACYVVAESRGTCSALRIRGRITVALKWGQYAPPPTVTHFGQCRRATHKLA